MLSKKQKILVQPFVEEKYKKHRNKVRSAQAAIDVSRPVEQPHVLIKLKKIQKERERMQEIEKENQRLLQKLSQIMSVNRLENYWREPHPTFLNRVYIKPPKTKRRARSVSKIEDPETVQKNRPTTSRSCLRCPTCSGRPQTTVVKIPEERVPFEPQRKSWNRKLSKETPKIHKCCKFCC